MNWEQVAPQLENIGNYLSMELAKILFESANELPDNSLILEIGAYHGFSTCALALGCVDTNKRIITIDTFHGNVENTDRQDGENYYWQFCENVNRLGLQNIIMPLIGKSEKFYRGWDFKIDLLFIDGNHRLMQQDFEAFFPHLRAGGVLLMHDIRDEYLRIWNEIVVPQIDVRGLRLNLGWGTKRENIS